MELTLVIVTLVSLALAMAMGVIAWRLLQEERLRATARVTALEQGLAASLRTDPVPQRPATRFGLDGVANAIRVESLANDNTDWLAQFPSSAEPVEVEAHADATDGSNDVGVAHAGLFAQTAEPSADAGLSRRIVAIAAVATIVIGAVLAFWLIGRVFEPRVVPNNGAGVAGAPTAGPAALELVSLRHVQQDGTLTITGLVRNPYGGAAQERLTAVVFFFDGQGGFLSSTRAPLDFRTLSPGEESPFQLAAPAPPGVARYRVSFRREEGAIVPHVDRRQQEASRS